MAIEPRRACGYRKVGGLYLCGSGSGFPCDRLPYPLEVCPTCHAGIKQSRGWTWIDVAGLTGGVHPDCKDDFACPFCMATAEMGKAGLLWIGERFYKTPAEFLAEANQLGISKRITAVPRNFKVGETWMLLAHPKAIERIYWQEREYSERVAALEAEGCCTSDAQAVVDAENLKRPRFTPGIFRIFRPARIELIITETQSKNAEFMGDLELRKITTVVVPDGDRDHQGTVYDEETELRLL